MECPRDGNKCAWSRSPGRLGKLWQSKRECRGEPVHRYVFGSVTSPCGSPHVEVVA